VHDAVFRRAEEVCRATESIQHSGAHYTGTIRMGVDVYFDRGVHADHTESANDFRIVRYLLGAQKKFVVVLFPAIIKAFKSFGRETDGSCSCEV